MYCRVDLVILYRLKRFIDFVMAVLIMNTTWRTLLSETRVAGLGCCQSTYAATPTSFGMDPQPSSLSSEGFQVCRGRQSCRKDLLRVSILSSTLPCFSRQAAQWCVSNLRSPGVCPSPVALDWCTLRCHSSSVTPRLDRGEIHKSFPGTIAWCLEPAFAAE